MLLASRLLESMEKAGMLKREQQGRQWYVVPADGSLDARTGSDAAADDEPTHHRGEDEFPF